MTLDPAREVEKFDRYAEQYRDTLSASVSASGEAPEYFARHKLGCLQRLGLRAADRVLDFGCGTGSLSAQLGPYVAELHGYDPSAESLRAAGLVAPSARLFHDKTELPLDYYDAVVMAGVLHHVPPQERPQVIAEAVSRLKPGTGRLFVFEHNPYNPLTRRAVRLCPFDDDAILLTPGELVRRLRGAQLSAVRQDFVLFFPAFLARCRPLEPRLRWLPLGAQTLTFGQRA
jgi:SAM-dependent methyltransferase